MRWRTNGHGCLLDFLAISLMFRRVRVYLWLEMTLRILLRRNEAGRVGWKTLWRKVPTGLGLWWHFALGLAFGGAVALDTTAGALSFYFLLFFSSAFDSQNWIVFHSANEPHIYTTCFSQSSSSKLFVEPNTIFTNNHGHSSCFCIILLLLLTLVISH